MKIKMEKQMEKLDRSSKALMICELINSVVDTFLYTFLVAYLLNITNDNIGLVSIYYIVEYVVTCIAMYFIGIAIKKYNISKIYRLGIVFKCVFVISIVILKENIQSYVVFIAFVLGLAETTYWGPCDNLIGMITNHENRKKYVANKKILGSILKIVTPIILGTSIDLLSFYRVSIYVLILTIFQIIFSFLVKVEDMDSSKLQLRDFLSTLKTNPNLPRLKIVYLSSILFGVLMNVISTIITILIVQTFKTNFKLGLLHTIFSITSILVVVLFKRIYKSKASKYILLVGGFVSLISVMLLMFHIGKTEIIIYNFINTNFLVILEVIFQIERFNNIENGIDEKYSIENQIFLVMIMQIGRIVGYAMLLLAGAFNNIIYLKVVLFLTTICVPIYSYYMYKLSSTSSC